MKLAVLTLIVLMNLLINSSIAAPIGPQIREFSLFMRSGCDEVASFPLSETAFRACEATGEALLREAQTSGKMKVGEFLLRLCTNLPNRLFSDDFRHACLSGAVAVARTKKLQEISEECSWSMSERGEYDCLVEELGKL